MTGIPALPLLTTGLSEAHLLAVGAAGAVLLGGMVALILVIVNGGND